MSYYCNLKICRYWTYILVYKLDVYIYIYIPRGFSSIHIAIYITIELSDTFIQFSFGFQSNNGNYYCVIYCLLLILIDQGWVCLIWKISLNVNSSILLDMVLPIEKVVDIRGSPSPSNLSLTKIYGVSNYCLKILTPDRYWY